MDNTMKFYPLITDETYFDAVILADGDFPRQAFLLALLAGKSAVVCCDGAANTFIKNGWKPTAIVGDGDSLDPDVRNQYAYLFHQVDEQETNDLNKAFRYCVASGYKTVAIVGASGKREDHTLANISLLVDFSQRAEVVLLTDYGFFRAVAGNACFETKQGMQVSVFNQTCRSLKSEGLKYPVYPFDQWWQGTLNEAVSDRFSLFSDGNFLIFQTWTCK